MSRLLTVFSLVLALSAIPEGLAGPACAQKHYRQKDCVEKCKANWGWTGTMRGTDRWGSVITKVNNNDWDSLMAEACGLPAQVTVSGTITSAAGTPTFITQPGPIIGAGLDPAEATNEASSSTVSPSVTADSSSRPVVSQSSSVVSSSSSIVSDPPVTTTSSTRVPRPTTTVQSTSSTRIVTSARPTPTTTSIKPQPPITQAPEPSPTASQPSSGNGSDNGSDDNSNSGGNSDIQAYLTAHNTIRSNHGASALVWSNELASKAQQWANDCVFEHSGGSLGALGENLAAGTGNNYGIAEAIKSWTDEVSRYNGNNPEPSHFTQAVWKGTQQLGCAMQMCDGIFSQTAKYFVCEYFPQGNIIGRFAQNVQV